MAKIILNNEEFDFSNFNRTTTFSEGSINSSGSIGGIQGTNVHTRLETLAQNPITSLSIKVGDNSIIYSLNDINARINNIEEYYDVLESINVGLNIQFS